jgi:hypothetical protein
MGGQQGPKLEYCSSVIRACCRRCAAASVRALAEEGEHGPQKLRSGAHLLVAMFTVGL